MNMLGGGRQRLRLEPGYKTSIEKNREFANRGKCCHKNEQVKWKTIKTSSGIVTNKMLHETV